MIQRFSSRRECLDQAFLLQRLRGAKAYDRIAGYFSSSIFNIAHEVLEMVNGPIRLVCNSDLDANDVTMARVARDGAMWRAWCVAEPERLSEESKPGLKRLYELLISHKMHIKVLPRETFGLEHGKAGIITLADGLKTAFIGSTNETYNAWKTNYELIWEDSSVEGVKWVQEEFDALWENTLAVDLADVVIQDIGRLSQRTIIPRVAVWREHPEPAAPIIETPIYRKENGLWEYQKYFIQLAFGAHQEPYGARFLLADMVGLGKTVQLALAGMLMTLYGDKPVLILAPKPLLQQWQDEMCHLLDLPSAIWTGRQWIDENGINYSTSGPEGIQHCPRRIGIVSHGLITGKSEIVSYLKQLSFECVIVDEVHKARRKSFDTDREEEKLNANNLLTFLHDISLRTHSLLLATATPVQIDPIEVWDLLKVLSGDKNFVLGNEFSNWNKPDEALDVVMRKKMLPSEDQELWKWIRNPLPPAEEENTFKRVRQSLGLSNTVAVAEGHLWDQLDEGDKKRVRRLQPSFAEQHNPFIRHIIRRTRKFLEETNNPDTNEPYLKQIKIELIGKREEIIDLPIYLQSAYDHAEAFCQLLAERMRGASFLKTLLLRRMGSTIQAGMVTAKTLLGAWHAVDEEDEDEEFDLEKLKNLTELEREQLHMLVQALNANQERDPKYNAVLQVLLEKRWLDKGCIIFSQYFESIRWLALQLSKDIPEEKIGVYAGGQKSFIVVNGVQAKIDREDLKQLVRQGKLRLLLGTDAASEGLNLQRLGSLVNLDLPWNPTRLEQRKGRIHRIGQLQETIYIYNMRYKGSVEDRVYELLSSRLEAIHALFGQIPEVLDAVWIDVALGRTEQARQKIENVPQKNPFEMKYDRIKPVSWEKCSQVLDAMNRKQYLSQGW